MRFTYVSDVAQIGRSRLAGGDEVGPSAARQERPCVTQGAQESHCPHLRSADVLLSSSGAFHTLPEGGLGGGGAAEASDTADRAVVRGL